MLKLAANLPYVINQRIETTPDVMFKRVFAHGQKTAMILNAIQLCRIVSVLKTVKPLLVLRQLRIALSPRIDTLLLAQEFNR
jgi:hypothetical protein